MESEWLLEGERKGIHFKVGRSDSNRHWHVNEVTSGMIDIELNAASWYHRSVSKICSIPLFDSEFRESLTPPQLSRVPVLFMWNIHPCLDSK